MIVCFLVACLSPAFSATFAAAQNSSLFDGSIGQKNPTVGQYSWTFQKPLETQPIQLHDLVTVIINQQSVVISEGKMDRKKKGYGDLLLPNWILFKGLSIVPDPLSQGVPHIRGEVDNKLRSEAQLETRDSMKFRMACSVSDIRPNGNLILEGRSTISNNEEVWEYSLTGEVRPRDIMPNNTVISENIADIRLVKREVGHVRDGYRRGWLLNWLDLVQPF
jgi:flagellar L-ring protein FlgH